MLRKIIIGWVCLIGAVAAAIGLTVQAAWRRLRARLTREPDNDATADEPAAS